MTDPEPYTPIDVPPDTDKFIYRYVTTMRNGDVSSVLTQIGIRQP